MQPTDTATLPVPPVPADLDLRHFPRMDLDVVRLRDSAFMAHSTPEQFRGGVLLWCAAWHQVPAGSLPNDDHMLGRYAGYGGNSIGWRRVRAGAMHGFVLCADGRYYHPVVCEMAIKAGNKQRKKPHSTAIKGRLEADCRPIAAPLGADCSDNSPTISTLAPNVNVAKNIREERRGEERNGEKNQNPITHASSLAAGARAFDEGKVGEEARAPAIKLPPKVLEHVPAENHARQAEFGKLAQDIVSAFKERGANPDFPPDTNQVWVWENQGYRATVILAAIKHALANSHKARVTTNLRWFDNAIAEAHTAALALGKLPSTAGRTPAEQDEAWRRRIANFRTDVSSWVAAYGPRPGNSGCKVPIPLLVELGYPISTTKPVLIHTQRSATA